MNGWLALNKPVGCTSRDAVDRAEFWFPGVRIGHAGTLDPLASGVLLVGLGSATRLIEYVQQLPKTYVVEMQLGACSATDDAEGPITPVENPPLPTEEEVRSILNAFVGAIEQVPPAHSAARVGGRRAYKLARKGEKVSLAPRTVRIDRITLVRYLFPHLEIIVDCSKGTYIRALARDLGKRLGCGGYVKNLQRTRIGPFRLEDAIPLDAEFELAQSRLLPLKAVLVDLPALTLAPELIQRLRLGQRLHLERCPLTSTGEVAVYDPDGEFVAIAAWRAAEEVLAPRKVF